MSLRSDAGGDEAALPSSGADVSYEIKTVAVIGAGTAGREFALVCAAAGFDGDP